MAKRQMTAEQLAMRDQADVEDYLAFEDRFPADTSSKADPMPPLVKEVAETGATDDESSGFMDWWTKDATQEKFQGLMGALGSIGAGLAGMPAGGTDFSSLERGLVRASQAPGEAKKRIQQNKFNDYIDQQLATTTDPHRRDVLMATKMNPANAAQYLSIEGPDSKQRRAERMAEIEHGYKMEELELQHGKYGRKGLPPTRVDEIQAAKAWRLSLTPKQRSALDKKQFNFDLMTDPSFVKFGPLLYSPSGGPLYTEEMNFDLSGTETRDDPDTGESYTIGKREMLEAYLAENWPKLSSKAKEFYEWILMKDKDRAERESSGDVGAVSESLGLP